MESIDPSQCNRRVVDYDPIPEEITCKELQFRLSAQTEASADRHRELCRSVSDRKRFEVDDTEVFDEGVVPTGSKESLAASASDDQSDLSDSDSGFSGSNKGCLTLPAVEPWYANGTFCCINFVFSMVIGYQLIVGQTVKMGSAHA